ncbi:hypothetical protein RHSIM_Rhsim10G0174400 [Rhododendron simsii]|nr:hypothetical protein RHSIM_Rhsim10G0174400 [Rhododendron simsii]
MGSALTRGLMLMYSEINRTSEYLDSCVAITRFGLELAEVEEFFLIESSIELANLDEPAGGIFTRYDSEDIGIAFGLIFHVLHPNAY